MRNFGWPDEGSRCRDPEALDEATLIEYYGYTDIQFEHRLTDADFDKGNADYKFRAVSPPDSPRCRIRRNARTRPPVAPCGNGQYDRLRLTPEAISFGRRYIRSISPFRPAAIASAAILRRRRSPHTQTLPHPSHR